jgi:hypothetical protein
MAKILNVKIEYFFDQEDQRALRAAIPRGVLSQKETLRLIRAFYKIKDIHKRNIIFSLIEALAKEPTQKPKA